MGRKTASPDGKKYQTISFTLYAETLYLLDVYSRKTGIPRSVVIRRMIEQGLPGLKTAADA